MGVHKRSGSGVGTRAPAGGANSRSQTDRIPITADMTQEEKDSATDHNKQIEVWMDDRARNNMSAKRSRLKKMMCIVDMDNTIKEYAHNIVEFKHAYDAFRAVIIRHNLWSELGHGFVEPVVWERPEVMREQESDVADHRARLEKEAETNELYELGLPFAEKLRSLVKKTSAVADRAIVEKALEEQRQKEEERARKISQLKSQKIELERRAAEVNAKLQHEEKQSEDYRIASEKYTGGGRAKREDAMELDLSPVQEFVFPVGQSSVGRQTRDDHPVLQVPKPSPFPTRQDEGDFAHKGKTERHTGTFHPALPVMTEEEVQAQKELEDELAQWNKSKAGFTNPGTFGPGHDGLPPIDFHSNEFGLGGDPFYNPMDYSSPEHSSPAPPIHEGLNHGGNLMIANPTAGNPNNIGSPSDINRGAPAYGQHWSAHYQHAPRFFPSAPQNGYTWLTQAQVQVQTQPQAHIQPEHHRAGNPVWDPMQHGYEHTFGDDSEA